MNLNHLKIAAALLAVSATPALAETHEVHPGESIQAAVNRANDGDTVAVRAGEYRESVYVKGKSRVRLLSADGRGRAHIISNGTPLFVQGGDRNEIRGFALSAGTGGNGLQIGGVPGDGNRRFATNFTVADNDIRTAGEDGIKAHQMDGLRLTGNVVENAGQSNNGNSDGGIDFVAVLRSRVEGNVVRRTGGNTCMLIKGGSAGNLFTNNSFGGCPDAIHVGGTTGDKYFADGAGGREAYSNRIENNRLCGSRSAIFVSDSVSASDNNAISNNPTGNCPAMVSGDGGPTADLDGGASPPHPQTPQPNLANQGSSAAGWKPTISASDVAAMRQFVEGASIPGCL